MGEKLTRLTIGSVARNVQNLEAGTGVDITAGVISVDTSDLYTKTEVDALLDDYYTADEVDTELADYYTKTEVDTELDSYYTKTEADTEYAKYLKKTDGYTKTEVDTKLGDYYKKTETYGKTEVYTKTEADTLLGNKVDKVTGKGLSTNDYTTAEKTKLAGIADGAEVNVQSDWNVTNASSDAFIKNKPTIPDVSNFYTKTQVDTALEDKVDKVTGKGLSANDYSNADKAIVDAVTTNLAGKVDKVTGKGLSANDYTDADKAIVDGVTTALAGKQNTLTAGSNITISGNTISATDTKYTAGDKIAISSANVISLNLTKADILTILGYKEATLTMTATDGTTSTETILVKE